MSDGESYTSAAKSNGVDYHDNSKLLPEVWSWPDNFLRDNSTIVSQYSYSSTWSSNYTMSNLPGPGRLLGKLFSSAGAILERFIGKLAQSKELWDFSLANTNLRKAVTFNVMKSGDTMQKEKAWGILLDYARCIITLIRFTVTRVANNCGWKGRVILISSLWPLKRSHTMLSVFPSFDISPRWCAGNTTNPLKRSHSRGNDPGLIIALRGYISIISLHAVWRRTRTR